MSCGLRGAGPCDEQNIITCGDKKRERRYEPVQLRGQTCLWCIGAFSVYLHGNRRTFKKLDFAYYTVQHSSDGDASSQPRYLHADCLLPLALSKQYNATTKRLTLRGETRPVYAIVMTDRFGEPLYRTNYVKKLDAMVRKHWAAEQKSDFLRAVRPLYREEIMFSFHCSNYKFNGDQAAFDDALRTVNRQYSQYGVSLELTAEQVGFILST